MYFTVSIDKLLPQTISINSGGKFSGLDTEKTHTVVIKRNGKVEAAFKFNFKSRGSEQLRLWFRTQYQTWQLSQAGCKHPSVAQQELKNMIWTDHFNLTTGDILRFAKAGNYTSYCRCVKAEAISNNKKKRNNNRKNGNKYLSWAFIEAAHHMKSCCPKAQSYYERKYAKSGNNGALATKSLAAKISKAVFYILRDQENFDMKKIFG
jgi:hypothetical protein